MIGNGLQDRGVGIPAIAKDVERTCTVARLSVERLTERGDLLGCAAGETGQPGGFAVIRAFLVRGFGRRPDGSGGVEEGDRHHAMASPREGHIGGELQYALSAHEVGLEVRAEGVAAPADSRYADAGFAEQGVINGDAKRSVAGEEIQRGMTNDGENLREGQPSSGEEAIVGRPIVELVPTGS